jgi:hypothetical protein
MAMHSEGVGLGTAAILHPPLYRYCHQPMEPEIAVPHLRHTDLDMRQARCECGERHDRGEPALAGWERGHAQDVLNGRRR